MVQQASGSMLSLYAINQEEKGESKEKSVNASDFFHSFLDELKKHPRSKTEPAIIPISKSSWWARLKKEDSLNLLSLVNEQLSGEFRNIKLLIEKGE